MRIYYLDEPLNEEELNFAKDALCQKKGLKSIQSIEQIRVPTILPTPGKKGIFEEDVEDRTQLAMNNLIRAGINNDIGTQTTWIMPKETHWGTIFQLAIYEITGFAPYVIQRWRIEGEKKVKRDIRLIDAHGMIGEKD